MRLDKENTIMFDTTTGAIVVGTAQLGDIINNVKPGSPAEELFIVAQVRSAITSAGAATLQLIIEQDSAVGFGTATEIVATPVLALAGLTAGTVLIKQRLPLELKQYIRAKTVVAVADTTGGEIDIFVSNGVDHMAMNPAS